MTAKEARELAIAAKKINTIKDENMSFDTWDTIREIEERARRGLTRCGFYFKRTTYFDETIHTLLSLGYTVKEVLEKDGRAIDVSWGDDWLEM